MKSRWTGKEVIDRIIECIRNHWYHIEMELKEEKKWKGTWEDRERWRYWDNNIQNNYCIIAQLQNILDITDEELDALLKEE